MSGLDLGLVAVLVMAALMKMPVRRRSWSNTLIGRMFPRVGSGLFIALDLVLSLAMFVSPFRQLVRWLVLLLASAGLALIVRARSGDLTCGCFGSASNLRHRRVRESALHLIIIVMSSAAVLGQRWMSGSWTWPFVILMLSAFVLLISPMPRTRKPALDPVGVSRVLSRDEEFQALRSLLIREKPTELVIHANRAEVLFDAWYGDRPALVHVVIENDRSEVRLLDALDLVTLPRGQDVATY